ncbi:calcium-binding protein [Microvirga arabica]|uniref:calcium-binding protein n=1 Tax=Microvirga arabica TaxID=1128671 RepID=UPI003617F2D7
MLNGGEGFDVADYSNAKAAVGIDLTEPSNNYGEAKGDAYDGIESWIGSDFNDTITANDEAQELWGGKGDDIIRSGYSTTYLDGGAGNDTLDGGTGGDVLIGGDGFAIVSYKGSNGPVLIDLSIGAANGGDATGDVFFSKDVPTITVEGIIGSSHRDKLVGLAALDSYLDGGAGADTLQGGSGNDTFVVDSSDDQVSDSGGTDTLIIQADVFGVVDRLEDGIENLIATETANNAPLFGNDLANIITGNSHANVIIGYGGADTLRGGDGNDTYHVHDASDIVEEASGTGTDTVYAYTSYSLQSDSRVEVLVAAVDGDETINLTGNSYANVLKGNGRANRLNSGSGNDRLIGGGGNDTLERGTGSNTAVFSGSRAESTITRNTDGTVTVKGPDGTDLLKNVRWLEFSDGTDFVNAAPAGLSLSNTVRWRTRPSGLWWARCQPPTRTGTRSATAWPQAPVPPSASARSTE